MPTLHIGPINAATPTPLTSDGEFDRVSAVRLCRRWLDIELDGVFLLGSMGEGYLLSDCSQSAFVETALAEAGGKLTIFVSAADTSLQRMRERAKHLASLGAPCIVLCAPPGSSPARTIAAIKSVADTCPVPCAYYEVPARTGVTLTLHDLRSILEHPNIVALKDSSSSELIAQGITSAEFRPETAVVLDGVEYRTAFSQALGYNGVLHGGGVLTGRRVRATWDLAASGRFREAIELDRENSLFLASIYNRFSRPLQNTVGQKYALQLLGVFDGPGVALEQSLDDASRARIERTVEAHRHWLEAPVLTRSTA